MPVELGAARVAPLTATFGSDLKRPTLRPCCGAVGTTTIEQAGIDTWSPCWYVGEGSAAHRAIDSLATQPTRRGRLVPEEIDGHRLGWFPESRLLYAEGHPAGSGRLAHGEALGERLEALEGALRDYGVPVVTGSARGGSQLLGTDDRPGRAGVRRLDITTDVRCEDGGTGLAVLSGIAALSPAALSSVIRRQRGGTAIETVSWMSARGLVGRAYDKGIEAMTAARGELVRLEAQYRWNRDQRRDAEELDTAYVRAKFAGRFVALWRASNGIKVVGHMAMKDKLIEAIEAGALTASQAEQILGYQLLAAGRDRAPGVSRTTDYRRRRLIEESGFVLADGACLEDVEVDLHAVFAEALEGDAWERRG
jgi:hypothetical protein